MTRREQPRQHVARPTDAGPFRKTQLSAHGPTPPIRSGRMRKIIPGGWPVPGGQTAAQCICAIAAHMCNHCARG
jgi:hypothetical protein